MAAHIMTALGQITEDLLRERVNWKHLQAALNLSTWTEDLDLEDWETLQKQVAGEKPISLALWVGEMTAKYRPLWMYLGEPATREEWRNASYEKYVNR